MDKTKFEVFVCSIGSKKDKIELDMREKLENCGVKTFTIDKISTKQRITSIIKLAKILYKNKIDILHTHCPSPDFYGKASAFLIHLNLVFSTIHDTKGYSMWRERIMKNITTKYIAISEEVKEYALKTLRISSRKVKIIYNGIDAENFTNCLVKKEDKLGELGINNYGKIVTTVGRVNQQKGHIYFIEAADLVLKKFPETHFLIVGNTQDDKDLYQKLIKAIRNKNLESKIIFTGIRQDIPEILAISDVFVLPSISEGFALVAIEAMSAGVPIVGTNVGIIPEVIINYENGIIVPAKNVGALANGIIYILSDEDRAKKMGLKGNEIAKKFTIEKTVSEYEKLYLSYLL
jgi:glycosyltransferase involved in cell wall biosynthesis